MYKSSTQTRSQTRRRTANIVEWVRNFIRNERKPNAEDFLFASQIDTETLNHVIEEGPDKGLSVVLLLTLYQERLDILMHEALSVLG